MHICCSNCAILPLETFLGRGMEIKGLWFNPNIHPYTEYRSRLASLKRLQTLWHLDIEYLDDYPLEAFLKSIADKGPERCSYCYAMRLEKTAESAKQMGISTFTTSLLASPYQKFDKIIEIGNAAGRKYGVQFFAEDLRSGWVISKDLVREFGLYRQKYCGCIYSEMERYLKKNR